MDLTKAGLAKTEDCFVDLHGNVIGSDGGLGVCLLCEGRGKSEKQRVKFCRWRMRGNVNGEILCKECWKSLIPIIFGRNGELL